MSTESIQVRYDDPELGKKLQAFAEAHRSKDWRPHARFNLTDIVLAATDKRR